MGTVGESSWMLYASFVISVITLIVLIYYAWLTSRIARASNIQSEGLSRPVMTVRTRAYDLDWRIVQAMGVVAAEVDNDLALINIGNGPALSLRWTVSSRFGDRLPASSSGSVPYLRPGEVLQAVARDLHSLPHARTEVVCDYLGVSGVWYRARIQLGERRVLEYSTESR